MRWALRSPHVKRGLHFCALTLLSVFGPGYQAVSALIIPTLTLMLYISRSYDRLWHVALVLWPAMAIGSFFAYAGSFETWQPNPFYARNTLLVIPAAAGLSGLAVAVLLLDRASVRAAAKHGPEVFSFPLFWAGFWTLVYFVSPLGDFGTWGGVLALTGVDSLTVGATWLFGSVTGGALLSALVASSLSQLAVVLTADAAAAGPLWRRWRGQLAGAAAAVFAVALVGSCVMTFGQHPGAFYQRPLRRFAPRYINVACLTKASIDDTVAFLQAQGQTTQLVLWSETSVKTADEQGLLDDALRVSERFGVYLGVTYLVPPASHGGWARNMFAFIVPPTPNAGEFFNASATGTSEATPAWNGDLRARVPPPPPPPQPPAAAPPARIARTRRAAASNQTAAPPPPPAAAGAPAPGGATIGFIYQKSHPVPAVEDNVAAGAAKVPYVDTPLGRIGGAICFDFDFPYLTQAHRRRVDVMLQPSWTWGPMGPLHATVNRLRAVEIGFVHLRCSSDGVSGIFDAGYGVGASAITLGRGDGFIGRLPLAGHSPTLVGALRGAPSYLAMAYFCLVLAYLAWLAAAWAWARYGPAAPRRADVAASDASSSSVAARLPLTAGSNSTDDGAAGEGGAGDSGAFDSARVDVVARNPLSGHRLQ